MFYVYMPDKRKEIPITADRILRSLGASGRYARFRLCNIHDRAGRKLRRKYPANTKRLYPKRQRLRRKTALGRTRPAHADRHLLGTWRQRRAERDCGQGAHPRPQQRRIHRYDSGIHKEWREARKSYGAGLLAAVCLPLINNVIYKKSAHGTVRILLCDVE